MNINMKRSIFCLLMAMIFAFSSITPVFAGPEEDIKKQEEELKKIQKQLKQIESEKANAKKSQKTVVNNINSIEGSIKGLEKEISDLNSSITDTEHLILEITANLQQTENKIDNKNDLLNKRLRTMYKSGSVGYLEVLLGASDFSDFLTRFDMVQKIYQHDVDLIKKLESEKSAIEDNKKKLEDEKARLQSLTKQVSSKQAQLSTNLISLQSKQSEIKQDLKALEEREDQLLEDANKVTDIIKNYKLMLTYVGGKMAWPAPGYKKITSPFGYRIHPVYKTKKLHTGIDIAVPYGEKVHAAQSGTVIYADWFGGYGKAVMIDHGGGYVTLYAHNSSLLVKAGDKVVQGQAISKCGSTGVSTGAHVHFEVRENGQYVDPLKWVTPN